jgi:hypothetical protein
MKRIRSKSIVMLVFLAALLSSSCITEETPVELVLTDHICAEFQEIRTNANYADSAIVDCAARLDDILADNGYSRSDIKSAKISSASFEVKQFAHSHDWTITGSVSIRRTDVAYGPEVLLNYNEQSIAEALGNPVPVDLNQDGVDLLNEALEDYLNGYNPQIVFTVVNGSVKPIPSESDTLQFDWEACLITQVVVADTLDLPDPL